MMNGPRTAALLALMFASPACGQEEVHPTKRVYMDQAAFPVATPADVSFSDGFAPFRAVWSREYRNHEGELRSDRVVLVADELSWYGEPVIALSYHDAGSPDAPDTNARTATVYLDRETLALVRATIPKSGSPWDYNVVHATATGVVTTTVSVETGQATSQTYETAEPVFGPSTLDFLVWAGLPLSEGHQAMVPRFSPDGNGLSPSAIRVLSAERLELPEGDSRDGWLIERPILQPDNARMHHFRLLDRPPYLVSRHVIDLESQETSFHLRLLEWELLGDG